MGDDREEGTEGASEPDDKKGSYAKAFKSGVTATRATINRGRGHVREQREGVQVTRMVISTVITRNVVAVTARVLMMDPTLGYLARRVPSRSRLNSLSRQTISHNIPN